MGNPMPVFAHMRDDFFYGLALIEDTDPIPVVAQKCSAHSIGHMVPERDHPLVVEYEGTVVDGSLTAAQAGITPLASVVVAYADA